MLFLMNDTMLDVDMRLLLPSVAAGRFRALSLAYVIELGRELYAHTPLLHRDAPERAERLAALIASKAPQVNAALFVAPGAGCRPDEVAARLAELDVTTIAALKVKQNRSALTPVVADAEVWRRMAA